MLMPVLKGEKAIKQSKTLIRIFKGMKDYLVDNNLLNKMEVIYESNNRTRKYQYRGFNI